MAAGLSVLALLLTGGGLALFGPPASGTPAPGPPPAELDRPARSLPDGLTQQVPARGDGDLLATREVARAEHIAHVASERLELDAPTTDALRAAVDRYLQARSERYRSLSSHERVDTAALLERSRTARESLRSELVELVGAQDADTVVQILRDPPSRY